MIVIPTGKQEGRRPRQPPVGAKNAKQPAATASPIAVLASFAMPNQDHALRAVDVRHSQPRDFRGPEPRRIGRVVSAARLFRLDTDSKNSTTLRPRSIRSAVYAGRAHRGYARERPPSPSVTP